MSSSWDGASVQSHRFLYSQGTFFADLGVVERAVHPPVIDFGNEKGCGGRCGVSDTREVEAVTLLSEVGYRRCSGREPHVRLTPYIYPLIRCLVAS